MAHLAVFPELRTAQRGESTVCAHMTPTAEDLDVREVVVVRVAIPMMTFGAPSATVSARPERFNQPSSATARIVFRGLIALPKMMVWAVAQCRDTLRQVLGALLRARMWTLRQKRNVLAALSRASPRRTLVVALPCFVGGVVTHLLHHLTLIRRGWSRRGRSPRHRTRFFAVMLAQHVRFVRRATMRE